MGVARRTDGTCPASKAVLKMNPADERAIAEFLGAGRRVSRVKEAVRVSEPELLDYLAGCGIVAQYKGGDDSRPYLWRGKRVNASALVEIANQQRNLLNLPPFALRTYPTPRPARRPL